MSDSYQAIYDAVRSRIHGFSSEQLIDAIARQFDTSHSQMMIRDQFMQATYEMQRPSVLWRPTVAPDGDKWSALYGPNLAEGVCGFGDTPALAMEDFDKNWTTQKSPMAGSDGR